MAPPTVKRPPSAAHEIKDLRRRLAVLRREHAGLLAAARAAVGAYYDGEPEPLAPVIDALDELRALPEYLPRLTGAAEAELAGAGPLVGRRLA
ncbi:hypothetical protein ACFP1Z_06695 [Streptomyces gamaensis]|uniref:Uncharacterized protein n=1 Tax=Streptomyces gamaensis TaxID=1763542 RepID=A0ABW0YWP5_9ACTN